MTDVTAPTAFQATTSAAPEPDATDPARRDSLRRSAEAFEAAFLAEMLRHAGLGRMPETFNGGAGEAAFSGTLIEEYARQIADQGGLGLADQIYRSLAARAGK